MLKWVVCHDRPKGPKGYIPRKIDLDKVIEELRECDEYYNRKIREAQDDEDYEKELNHLAQAFYITRKLLMKVLIYHGRDPNTDYV